VPDKGSSDRKLRRRSRIKGGKLVVIWLSGFLLLPALPAQSLRDPRFMAQTRPGFNDIYNLDLDQAEQVFLALKKDHPEHPAPPLYMGAIAWLRELFRRQNLDLDLFLSPAFFTKETSLVMPPGQREAFLDDIRDCQTLTQKILDKNPKNTEALYFLGASYGILSSFSITIDHSLSRAFSYGDKAYGYNRRILSLDPNYYDAHLTVGLYKYIVGSVPWYLKPFALILGYRGNKGEGLREIDLAAAKGEYVKTEAKIVQMVLLMREGRPKDALVDAQELRREFPRNYIFQINVAQILATMGQDDQAVSEYLDVVRQAERGRPNYNLLPLSTFRYSLGYKFFNMGRLALAREQFQRSIADPATPDYERAWSHLRLGQILDLEGKRDQAIERYQEVLKLKEASNSHDMARKFLEKPYRG
jgi:tetratricopeptide (TPR) repeat protein